jgi:long-chain fatty acid transport protein
MRICHFELKKYCVSAILFFFSFPAHASFIESTMGTAVLNDAVATYYNPAALVQLKNPQLIALNSISIFHGEFTGTVTQPAIGFRQAGSSTVSNRYQLPALYVGSPVTNKITAGIAMIANDVNRDIEGYSILRYVQSNNSIQDIDVVPAFSLKINDYLAIGAGLTVSRAYFLMQPVYGVPSLNIQDSQSRNESNGTAYGGDIGFFIKPTLTTAIGFNYRGAMTYRMSGTSTLMSQPEITSHNYHFTYWTPARSVLSANHFVTKKLGFIGTLQYIQWNIFKDIRTYNLALQSGNQPVILPMGVVHYHFHNSWLFTLGSQYRISSSLILRVAGSYIQSPSNGYYQIDNGDSIILGASLGYQLYKNIFIDGSYAHAFVKDRNIHIVSALRTINGTNTNAGNAFSLKLTVNG